MSVSITFIESKAKQNKTQESICYQGVIALALNLHLEFLFSGVQFLREDSDIHLQDVLSRKWYRRTGPWGANGSRAGQRGSWAAIQLL